MASAAQLTAILLLLVGLYPGAVTAQTAPAAAPVYTLPGYFSCTLPTDWLPEAQVADDAIAGVTRQGPRSDTIPARLSAHYYAAGNHLYASAEQYIQRHAEPAGGSALAGNRYTPASPIRVADRAAQVFERTRSEFVPLRNELDTAGRPAADDPRVYERAELMARAVVVRERFVVIPGTSGGFYVLHYSAAFDDYTTHQPHFNRLVATFQPLR
ncbi:MAG: hypothetical protein AB1450_01790 [Pseudomonadota bacterium]